MTSNYERQALAEDLQRQRFKEWTKLRINQIHSRVTAHDVLRRNGYTLRSNDGTEQISCPFHGRDNKPSARVFAADANGRTGVWCYVCNEQWDCISLWRKFTDWTGKFSGLLFDIEQAYGLERPENMPEISFEDDHDYVYDELRHLVNACDRRLVSGKHAFDMEGFLKLSVAIDRIRAQADARKIKPEQGNAILRTILEKIGAKVRACKED